MKTYIVQRNVRGSGGAICKVIRAFDDESEAKKAAESRQSEMLALLEADLVWPNGAPVGHTLKEVMEMLGVSQIGHFVVPLDVHGADIVIPAGPRLVMSS